MSMAKPSVLSAEQETSRKGHEGPSKNEHGDAIREEFKLLPENPGFETSNPS